MHLNISKTLQEAGKSELNSSKTTASMVTSFCSYFPLSMDCFIIKLTDDLLQDCVVNSAQCKDVIVQVVIELNYDVFNPIAPFTVYPLGYKYVIYHIKCWLMIYTLVKI